MSAYIRISELKKHLQDHDIKKPITISKMVGKIIDTREITQAEFSRITGISTSVVCKMIKHADYKPDFETVARIMPCFPEIYDPIDYLISYCPPLVFLAEDTSTCKTTEEINDLLSDQGYNDKFLFSEE